jgi:hypothetical protein
MEIREQASRDGKRKVPLTPHWGILYSVLRCKVRDDSNPLTTAWITTR